LESSSQKKIAERVRRAVTTSNVQKVNFLDGYQEKPKEKECAGWKSLFFAHGCSKEIDRKGMTRRTSIKKTSECQQIICADEKSRIVDLSTIRVE